MSESRASSTRRNTLQRGKACIRCRRRKMRCDSKRPVCTPCVEAGRVDDCEYTDNQGRTRTQILEENILTLEARLRELEGNPQSESSQQLTLYNPYAPPQSLSLGTDTMQTGADTRVEYNPVPGISLEHPWNMAWWEMEDPPTQISDTLVSVFLPHALALGFVLSPSRFRTCVGLPINHPERPHASLMNAVYLWALRISFYNQTRQHEDLYLQRAILALNDPFGYNIQGANDSQLAQRRIQAVQAEVLISNYFFCLGQLLEGRYHVNAAVTLALSCGLHRTRSSLAGTDVLASHQDMNSPLSPVVKLTPARDSNELAERINVFWAVHNLDCCWSAALGSPRFITDDVSRGTQVETTWPSKVSPERVNVEPYGDSEYGDLRVIQQFLLSLTSYEGGISVESRFALRAKVSVLYERTARLVDILANGQGEPINDAEIHALAHAVANFARCLVPLDEENWDTESSNVDDIHKLLIVTHCLAHASMINLHSILIATAESANASEQSVTASIEHASEIITILELISRSDRVYSNLSPENTHVVTPDPILAIVGMSAARVLIEEKRRSLTGFSQEPPTNTRLEQAQSLLNRAKDALRKCSGTAENYAIFLHQVMKIEEFE